MPSTPTQDIQDEILSTIRKSQETVIDAIKTWVETVQSITPKIPSVQVPGVEQLLGEVVGAGHDKFAEEVLKATTSLLPGTQDSAPGK